MIAMDRSIVLIQTAPLMLYVAEEVVEEVVARSLIVLLVLEEVNAGLRAVIGAKAVAPNSVCDQALLLWGDNGRPLSWGDEGRKK